MPDTSCPIVHSAVAAGAIDATINAARIDRRPTKLAAPIPNRCVASSPKTMGPII